MQRQEKIAQMNRTVMQKMSVFLNYEPNFVKKDMLDELNKEKDYEDSNCGIR